MTSPSLPIDSASEGGAFESVAVVGLGKLGLPLASILAAGGCVVHGIDSNALLVQAVNKGEYHGHEPEVAELLSEGREFLTAAVDYAAVPQTQAAFVVVPTPSGPGNGFSLEHVLPVIRAIVREVAEAELSRYTIVLVSTVMPGACEGEILPAIREVVEEVQRTGGEEENGRYRSRSEQTTANRSRSERTTLSEPTTTIELVYAPEFVALGDVVRGMTQPNLILVGGQTKAAADRVASFLETFVTNRPTVVRTNLVNAEIAKLAVNVLVSVKLTCANLLAEICGLVPWADVDVVTRAVGADPRIGRKFLRGGLGYGGPCFPRDVRALSALCREMGIDARLPESVTDKNDSIPALVADCIHLCHRGRGALGVLGLAYRPGTNIVEASQAVEIVRWLASDLAPIHVYDPLVQSGGCPLLTGTNITWHQSVQSVCAAAGTIVIASQAAEFWELDPAWLANKTIFDCWRHLPAKTVAKWRSPDGPPGFRYFAWGLGPDVPAEGGAPEHQLAQTEVT